MTPRLSVGIMVKNQAKELRECLERLEQTRNSIDTEIIIHVDDSTTENTFDVARKFTDKVRYFKWIDDYSAIKNGIMDEATGEWIWILDADEFACDTAPLIEFLNSEETKKYSILEYYERNFFDKQRKNSILQYASRIYKKSENHRYVGKVHESVYIDEQALKHLEMYVDHTGYIELEKNEKRKVRQAEVEREYEKNPEDLRIIVSLADTFSNSAEDIQETISFLEKHLKVARKNPEHFCSGNLYYRLVRLYCQKGEMVKAEGILSEYKKVFKKESFSLGEIYNQLAKGYCVKEQYELSLKYFDEFFKLYKKAENGTICTIDKTMPFYNALILNGDGVKELIAIYAVALAKTGQLEKAREQLDRKELKEYDSSQLYRSWFVLSKESNDASLISKKYLEVANSKLTLESCRAALEVMLTRKNLQEIDFKIIKALAELDGICDDVYIKFNCLRADGNFENAQSTLNAIANSSEGWAQNAFAFILYRILKDKIPMCKAAKGELVNKLFLAAEVACQFDDGYKKLINDYIMQGGFGDSLQELRLQKEIMAQEIKSEIIAEDIDLDFFKAYFDVLGLYAINIVPPEFLEEENLTCLPQELQMGVKLYEASEAQNKKDMVAYVMLLKEIIKIDPSMAGAVKGLLEEIKQENNKQEKVATEIDTLAEGIKNILNQFIIKKDKANALAIFQRLQDIVPNDKDLPQLIIKIDNI